ncbi:site-specific recombinase XerD [Granulicella aggregans]|uniref:Site-specific recombinase XerD n=1 Tax=Granulicella aggregans TaxID=474949 RepID=A0A7W7ZLB5_9BACT|nr:tyrosine-type recombinase/integrase [Granulicella aggregans]MBB5061649.1 site-specific recombinase XerD [Granulicella aggregans]
MEIDAAIVFQNNDLRVLLPALVGREGEWAALRFLEFFTVHIRNANTRSAYARAAKLFLGWCEARGISELRAIQPMHVAGYIELLQKERSAPTVKQHLACLRMLFDWLVTGQIVPANPAHSVRGPRHSVDNGSTPVISSAEARDLLDSMDATSLVRLRDRALVAVMAFTFARVSAVVDLKVEDYYPQKKRWWLRLHEKNGKVHQMPCHHKLEAYLDAYLAAAGIRQDGKGWLFRSAIGRTGKLTNRPVSRTDVWYMVQRRANSAQLETAIGCHTFRATGITDYLTNGGKLEVAQRMAGHSNAKTTGLYDRRSDDISLSEVEKIGI